MVGQTELRLFNKVSWKGGIDNVVGIELDRDGDGYFVTLSDKLGGIAYASTKDLDPVPLTPEWLKWCGFEINGGEKDGWNYSNKDGFTLTSKYRHAQWGWYYNDYEITTLHQLQNVFFALTGEELTIKETV
jgi:hypothetical protein